MSDHVILVKDCQGNEYEVSQPDEIATLTINLASGSVAPDDLEEMCQAAVRTILAAQKGTRHGARHVALSGRLPAWAVAAIHHALKPYCQALYQYDPKVGNVLVMNHRNHLAVGVVR
jgi:hypothetical protein